MDSRRPLRSLLALLLILPIASAVQAGPYLFSASSGNLAASVNFAYVGGTSVAITLTNTSTHDVMVPADILTAVFFNVAGNPTLTRVSAVLNSGSAVYFDAPPAGGVVGGEWAYKFGAGGLPGVSQEHGISSAGFGIFGSADNFPGPDLDPPGAPNGLNYGITSAGDNLATGNAAVTGGFPLIKNSVVFTLSGFSGIDSTTDLSQIFTGIRFQYGTSLTEPNFPITNPVPVPAGVLLMGLGGVCLAGYNIRRNRKVTKLA